jgi:hypothetical protein
MTYQGVAALPGLDQRETIAVYRQEAFGVDIFKCADEHCRTVEIAAHEPAAPGDLVK